MTGGRTQPRLACGPRGCRGPRAMMAHADLFVHVCTPVDSANSHPCSPAPGAVQAVCLGGEPGPWDRQRHLQESYGQPLLHCYYRPRPLAPEPRPEPVSSPGSAPSSFPVAPSPPPSGQGRPGHGVIAESRTARASRRLAVAWLERPRAPRRAARRAVGWLRPRLSTPSGNDASYGRLPGNGSGGRLLPLGAGLGWACWPCPGLWWLGSSSGGRSLASPRDGPRRGKPVGKLFMGERPLRCPGAVFASSDPLSPTVRTAAWRRPQDDTGYH